MLIAFLYNVINWVKLRVYKVWVKEHKLKGSLDKLNKTHSLYQI